MRTTSDAVRRILCVGLFLAGIGTVRAGPADELLGSAGGGSWGMRLPVDIKADQMEYDQEAGVVKGIGHVVIRRTNEVLQADRVELHVNRNVAEAHGNVVFTRDRTEWRGSEFTYNFVTRDWSTGPFHAYVDPFYIAATGAARASEISYVIHDAVLTTCTNSAGESHYTARARRLTITPGRTMTAHNVVFYLGDAPVFYTPVWYRSLSDRYLGVNLRAGFRGSWGGYLLTGLKYPTGQDWRGTTHIDWRSSRGVALGQDLDWRQPDGEGRGGVAVYYAQDKGLEEDHTAEEAETLDEGRYRVRAWYNQPLSPKDYVLAEGNYLGDPYVIEDFFDSEYRESAEPENYLSAVHREDDYALGLLLRTRVNDYFSVVNRLPEVTLDVPRQPIAESPFYYESASAGAHLQMAWEEGAGEEDYSVTRFDSRHTVYYPTRHFGFLNFMPRMGVRGTYFSETFDAVEEQTAEWVSTTNTTVGANGATSTVVTSTWETNTTTRRTVAGSQFRGMVELGAEVSFKAFRTWDTDRTRLLDGLRHVVEPYADYTLIPEPNVTPDHLYQFDEVDALDEAHYVKVGVRNKWQTRRDGRPHDLVDADLYTTFDLSTDEGEDELGSVVGDADVTIADWWRLETDLSYDPNSSTLAEWNTRLWYIEPLWRLGLEYRYKNEESSLLSPVLNLTPTPWWIVEAYARFEAETSELEEDGLCFQRNFDCLAVRAGVSHIPGYTQSDGTEREDEFRAELGLWLLAFPGFTVGSSERHAVELDGYALQGAPAVTEP